MAAHIGQRSFGNQTSARAAFHFREVLNRMVSKGRVEWPYPEDEIGSNGRGVPGSDQLCVVSLGTGIFLRPLCTAPHSPPSAGRSKVKGSLLTLPW